MEDGSGLVNDQFDRAVKSVCGAGADPVSSSGADSDLFHLDENQDQSSFKLLQFLLKLLTSCLETSFLMLSSFHKRRFVCEGQLLSWRNIFRKQRSSMSRR